MAKNCQKMPKKPKNGKKMAKKMAKNGKQLAFFT
jgi:hypothetical protein